MTKPKQPIPDRLKAWRQTKNLTQAQAATQLGCSPRTYQDWEQGRYTPKGATLKLIEMVTGGK